MPDTSAIAHHATRMPNKRRPIDHARALMEAVSTGKVPADTLAWAAAGMALYVYQGIDLKQAFGLVRYGGGGGHAGEARREQRDNLLREVHRRHFGDMGLAAAAAAIVSALKRQERARGRVDNDLSRSLESLLHFEPAPPASVRQLRKILASISLF